MSKYHEDESSRKIPHPSEVDTQIDFKISVKDSILYYKNSLARRVNNAELGIDAEGVKAIATASVGALAVMSVALNFDEIVGLYGSLSQWTEDKISEYLNSLT